MFKIKRFTQHVGPYIGFLSDDNIRYPFLGNYSDTKIFLYFLWFKIKKLYHYRIDVQGKFYKSKH